MRRIILLSLACGLLTGWVGCCGPMGGGLLGPCGPSYCGPSCGPPCGGDCGTPCGPYRRPIAGRVLGPPCATDCGPACGPCGPCGSDCGPGVGPIRWLLGHIFFVEAWCGPPCGERYFGDFWGDPSAGCDPCDRCGNWSGGGGYAPSSYRTGGGCATCGNRAGYSSNRPPAYEGDEMDASGSPENIPAPEPQPTRAPAKPVKAAQWQQYRMR
jgi:hypothetical protein